MPSPASQPDRTSRRTATTVSDWFRGPVEGLTTSGISLFSSVLSGILSLAAAAAGNIPILSTTERLLDGLGESELTNDNFGKIYH